MKKIITNLILITGFLMVKNADSNGQSVMFNQYFVNSVFENPAFAGAFERPVFSVYYGQHISPFYNNNFSENPNYNNIGDNFGFSYQQYSDLLKGGIGISFSGVHYSADGNYSVLNDGLKLSYSPTIKICKKIYLKPGIEIGLYYEKEKYPAYTDTSKTFVANYEIYPHYMESIDNFSNMYPDINVGLLLYGANFHVALSVNHLNNPRTYALNNYIYPDFYYNDGLPNSVNTKQPVRNLITVTLGMNINSKDSGKTSTFSPHLFVQNNGYYHSNYTSSGNNNIYNSNSNVLLGFTYRYKRILTGLDLGLYDSNNTGLIPMIGYQNKMFRISYSYVIDLKENGAYPVSTNTPGLSSILLTYMLPSKTKSTPPLFTTIN